MIFYKKQKTRLKNEFYCKKIKEFYTIYVIWTQWAEWVIETTRFKSRK